MIKLIKILCAILAVYASISSTILLCNRFPYNENLNFDYSGVIIGILSLLVTLLIGWQITTYFMQKEAIKEMIKTEMGGLLKDFQNALEAKHFAEFDDTVVVFGDPDYKKINRYFLGLEKALLCKDQSIKQGAINDIMNTFHKLYIKTEHTERKIYKGKRNQYLYIINGFSNLYISELKEYIETAQEVEIEKEE